MASAMHSLATEIHEMLVHMGPDAQASLKRTFNKERYAAAVKATWRTRPDIATFVLMHTNSIFIKPDEKPRTGPRKNEPWMIFGIYLDDAMARTEVDAWQAVLMQALAAQDFTVNEIRIFPAKWDMRGRRLFPELWEEGANLHELENEDPQWRSIDESKALDVVKRAVCQVFEDPEHAWALLEQVRGAAVRRVPAESVLGKPHAERGRVAHTFFRLFLYVEDVEGVRRIMTVYAEALKSRMYRMGLPLASIWVRKAPAALAGQHAFRRVGASVPLKDESFSKE
jgi:hypothetical protein